MMKMFKIQEFIHFRFKLQNHFCAPLFINNFLPIPNMQLGFGKFDKTKQANKIVYFYFFNDKTYSKFNNWLCVAIKHYWQHASL